MTYLLHLVVQVLSHWAIAYDWAWLYLGWECRALLRVDPDTRRNYRPAIRKDR